MKKYTTIAVVVLFVFFLLLWCVLLLFFFFSSRRRHTRFDCDWSSDVCSSDLRFGKYGRLEALNLETKKVLWTYRQRAPLSSGVLATAGGVVFAGGIDRVFAARSEERRVGKEGRSRWAADH